MKSSLKCALAVTVSVLAVVFPWIIRPGYVFFTDFAWGPRLDLDWQRSGWPFYAAVKAVGLVVTPAVAEKLFLAGVLVLLMVAGWRVARAVTGSQTAGFLVALFSLFNPFVYDRLGYGQVGVLLGLGFFLLGAADLVAFTQERRQATWHSAWRPALWLGLAAQASPHFLVFGAVLVAALSPLLWRVWPGSVRSKLTTFTLVVALTLAVNVNWLVPQLFLTGSGSQATQVSASDLVAFKTVGRSSLEAYGNVLMLSGFWGKEQYRYLDLADNQSVWGRSQLFLLPIIICGLLLAERESARRRLFTVMVPLAVVAAFLAVGLASPSGAVVTRWLFEHVPFFGLLRETQKWAVFLVLAYMLAMAVGLEGLLARKLVARNSLVFSAFIGAVIVMQAPLMLGGLNGAVRPHEYPADWAEVESRLKATGCAGTTIVLPWHMYLGFKWIGGVVANPAEAYFSCPMLVGTNMEWGGIYDQSGDARGGKVTAWMNSRGSAANLAAAPVGARHIIVLKEADWKNMAWLDGSPQLTKVFEGPTIMLYEIGP